MVVDIVVVDKQKKTAVVIDVAIPKWFKDGLMTQKKYFFLLFCITLTLDVKGLVY